MPIVAVIVMLYDFGGGKAEPPHPESEASALREIIIRTPSAAHRRRRLAGMKKKPASVSAGVASGQAEPVTAVVEVVVLIVSVEEAEVLPGVTAE